MKCWERITLAAPLLPLLSAEIGVTAEASRGIVLAQACAVRLIPLVP